MDEAKDRFRVGLKLYDDGAYEAARVQFERAYELAPSYKLLYNIGLVYNQLHDFTGSLKALEEYLSVGGAEVPADKRAEVTKLISDLKLIVASATITANIPGVEISVDDAVIGKSPLDKPILLNPGRRKISGKFEGRLPDAKVITVASGDKVDVALNLPEPPKTTIVKTGTDWMPVVAWTVTGALAVGAGVTSYLALKAENDLSDLKTVRQPDQGSTLRQQLDDQHTKVKTLSVVSDILIVATVVGVGVSTYFTWFAGKKSDEKAATPAASIDLQLLPGGLGATGTF